LTGHLAFAIAKLDHKALWFSDRDGLISTHILFFFIVALEFILVVFLAAPFSSAVIGLRWGSFRLVL
jgi:hypothetical protein